MSRIGSRAQKSVVPERKTLVSVQDRWAEILPQLPDAGAVIDAFDHNDLLPESQAIILRTLGTAVTFEEGQMDRAELLKKKWQRALGGVPAHVITNIEDHFWERIGEENRLAFERYITEYK